MTQKLLGNRSRGLVFVVSAPAGTGKTTLVQMLMDEFSCVKGSVSSTTRSPRKEEINGLHYHFITEAEFIEKRNSGDFLEYAEVFGNWYGTSKENLDKIVSEGNHAFLVIDTQGALQLQKARFEAVYIFIAPPKIEALQERLIKRQTEDEAKREERLSWAKKEMDLSSSYDYLIVNGDLQVAYSVLKSIVIAEEHKIVKNK